MADQPKLSPGHDPAQAGTKAAAFSAASQITLMPTVLADCRKQHCPVIFANAAFTAMTGHIEQDVLGQPMLGFFNDRAEHGKLALMQSAMARGHAGVWQVSCQRPNGTTFLAVVFLTPVRSRDGSVVQYVMNMFDLGSMLRNWDKQNTDPFLYDKAPGAIAITRGPQHQLTYVNRSFREFVGRNGLIGRTVADALPEIAVDEMIATIDQVYRTGVPFRGSDLAVRVWNPLHKRIEKRVINVIFSPVRDDRGAITGLFSESYDVTGLHKAKEALAIVRTQMIHVARVNAMGTMAATLAHELNQPLTAIGNYIAGAKAAEGQPPDVDRMLVALAGIEQVTQRAATIVNHLRQLTKHRKPKREVFNLKSAVAECIRLVRPSCHHAARFFNVVPEHICMTADRVQIQQVLINLLQNAGEATEGADDRQITVKGWELANVQYVSVTDSGGGIVPEATETLFSWSESTKITGMGLGLSICRTIIELHGGTIWLEKTGPAGSEFRFSIPIAHQ